MKKWNRHLLTTVLATSLFLTTVPAIANVTPEYKNWYENSLEYASVCAMGETGERLIDQAFIAPNMQLSNFSFMEGKDFFYFVDCGMIKAYSYETGELAWTNYDFLGSVAMQCYAVDDENTLYVAGYYGPDIMVIDAEGNTITRVDVLDESVYWPYAMELLDDGTVNITYEMDESTRNIDMKQLEGTIEDANYADQQFEPGTPLEVFKCNEFITLRTYGSTSAPEITKVPLGSDVTFIHGDGNEFSFIAFENYRGYVLTEYLTEKK